MWRVGVDSNHAQQRYVSRIAVQFVQFTRTDSGNIRWLAKTSAWGVTTTSATACMFMIAISTTSHRHSRCEWLRTQIRLLYRKPSSIWYLRNWKRRATQSPMKQFRPSPWWHKSKAVPFRRAYRNVLCVLCAEGARKRKCYGSINEMMACCTNPAVLCNSTIGGFPDFATTVENWRYAFCFPPLWTR